MGADLQLATKEDQCCNYLVRQSVPQIRKHRIDWAGINFDELLLLRDLSTCKTN